MVRWLERSPITEALPGEAESLGVHEESRSKGRFRQCPLKRSSESIDLGSDPSVVFYRSEFENVIQDRYGLREA